MPHIISEAANELTTEAVLVSSGQGQDDHPGLGEEQRANLTAVPGPPVRQVGHGRLFSFLYLKKLKFQKYMAFQEISKIPPVAHEEGDRPPVAQAGGDRPVS